MTADVQAPTDDPGDLRLAEPDHRRRGRHLARAHRRGGRRGRGPRPRGRRLVVGACSFDERAERLTAWAGVMTRRIAQLADVVHQETGKPHSDATLEAALALDHIAWAAKNARKVLGRHKVSSGLVMANQAATVQYQPLGVIGVIGPWNYPVFTPMGSIAYALAAGNAVVFKPSELTPGVGYWLAATFAEVVPEHAGVPGRHRAR